MNFINNTEENFLKEAQNKNVICFGAGDIFQQFLKENAKKWNIRIGIVLDNDINKQGKCIDYQGKKIEVKCPASIDLGLENCVLVITSKAVNDIRKQLLKSKLCIFSYPFNEMYPDSIDERKRIRFEQPVKKMLNQYFVEFGLQEKHKIYITEKIEDGLLNGIVLPYITSLITSKCTLRCKDCNNLIQYCKEGRMLPKTIIIKDLERICSVIDCCVGMNVTGGEPFLHPDLGEVIRYTTENCKILFTEIITNGTVLPSRKLLESMKHEKVIVKISQYNGYSKIQELKEVFEKEGIRYIINNNLKWIQSGGVERRNKEYEQIKYEYLSCWPGKICKSLWEGKLYACARAAFLHEIGISSHPSDFLDLSKYNLKQSLLEFYLKDYVDACDFCDYKNCEGVKVVQPAIQCH